MLLPGLKLEKIPIAFYSGALIPRLPIPSAPPDSVVVCMELRDAGGDLINRLEYSFPPSPNPVNFVFSPMNFVVPLEFPTPTIGHKKNIALVCICAKLFYAITIPSS